MKAGVALALTSDPQDAARSLVPAASASLNGLAPTFGVLFASPDYFETADELVAAVTLATGPLPMVGCVAESVIGGGREVESQPAVALWLAADVGPVETFAMQFVRTPSGGTFGGYRFDGEASGVYLMVADPFTFPADGLLTHLNREVPGTVVLGGLASGGLRRQRSRLFLDGRVLDDGAVGARLADAEIHTLVSQGCRPVGEPYTVTRADGHVIYELGGRPPLERLRELAERLPEPDRDLLASGVQVGKVIDEYSMERQQGDFLIRGLAGADPVSGAIAVGDDIEVGQTVQFHVRDASSADEDLRRALRAEAARLGGRQAGGALLFTCNGRGSRLFARPDHDAELVAKTLGDVPVAGLFCAGELGPVGGQNFLHGFTASIAVFPASGNTPTESTTAEADAAEADATAPNSEPTGP